MRPVTDKAFAYSEQDLQHWFVFNEVRAWWNFMLGALFGAGVVIAVIVLGSWYILDNCEWRCGRATNTQQQGERNPVAPDGGRVDHRAGKGVAPKAGGPDTKTGDNPVVPPRR